MSVLARTLLALAALGLGVVAGLGTVNSPDSVKIEWNGWQVTLAPLIALIMLAVLGWIAYLLTRLLVRTFRVPQTVSAWRRARAIERAEGWLAEGAAGLAEGRYAEAASRFERLAKTRGLLSSQYLCASIGGAFAAMRTGNQNSLAKWEHRGASHLGSPSLHAAMSTMMAAFHAGIGNPAACAVLLQGDGEAKEVQGEAELLLARMLARAERWDELEPYLERLSASELDGAQISPLFVAFARAKLPITSSDALWRRLPADVRDEPRVLMAFAESLPLLDAQKREVRAETLEGLISERLDRDWSDALCRSYAGLACSVGSADIARAESWVEAHPESAAACWAAGNVCVRASMWGKARSFFRMSADIEPTAEVYLALARLERQLGDDKAADEWLDAGVRAGETRSPIRQAPALTAD